MKLNVVSIERELVRVQAEGDITTHDLPADGRNPFEAVLGSRWASHQVLVDLRGVPFLDSSAIGWFMATRRECERGGGLVVLHSIQPRVRQVLDLLHVGKAVPIVENEAAALTVVAAAAAGLRVQSAAKAPAAPKGTNAKATSGKSRRASKAA